MAISSKGKTDGRGVENAQDRATIAAANEPQPGSAPNSPTDMPKAGWFAIVKRSVRQFKHDDITDRAGALTYFNVLALFPAMLVLVSVLGLLGESTTNKVLNNIGSVAPGEVNSFLHSVVSQVQGQAGTAGIAGIIGLAVALWSASAYVAAFMRAANAIFDIDEGRPIWKTVPVRLLTTLALVIMMLVAAAIVVLTGPIAREVGSAFGIGSTAVLVWDIAKWPVLIILVSMMVTLLYKATPNVKQPSFRWVSAGGVLAVIVWVAASALFAIYVSFSGSYNKTYGSFATIIIFLVWCGSRISRSCSVPNSTPKPRENAHCAPASPTASNPSSRSATPASSATRRRRASKVPSVCNGSI